MPRKQSVSGSVEGGKITKATVTAVPLGPNFVQRKTERSHEENQERAYIAASRRADRSVEARIQSARMASEIHKKRTGKGFRITEEIVMKEEMYEEEEEDFPRSYRLLGPHLQTASPEMNSRVEAYLTNKVAMSAYLARNVDEWRSNEINKLFAQSFPNAGAQAQQLTSRNNSILQRSPTVDASPQSPTSPTFHTPNYQPQTQQVDQHAHLRSPSNATASAGQAEQPTSPADMGSPGVDATDLHSAMFAPSNMDFFNDSSFTTELPGDVKLMMGGMPGSDNPFSQNFYGQEDWLGSGGGDSYPYASESNYPEKMQEIKPDFDPASYADNMNDSMKWDATNSSAAMDEPWDTFINDSAWTVDP